MNNWTVRHTGTGQHGVSGTVDNVDPTGVLTVAAERELAELVADAAGVDLERYFSWTVTRYSLDHTAIVTLHNN